MAQSLLPNQAPTLRPGSTKTGRKVYIGIPVTSVAAAATADVECKVLEEFKLNRPFLGPAAQALLVNNIRVGTKPLNVSSNPISGNVFSEQAINNELSGYTANGNQAITINVTTPNAGGGAAIILSGGFLGWAAL